MVRLPSLHLDTFSRSSLYTVLGLQGHPEFNADEVMEKIYPDVASLPGVQGRSEQSIHDELKSTVGTAAVIDFVYAFLCLDSKAS